MGVLVTVFFDRYGGVAIVVGIAVTLIGGHLFMFVPVRPFLYETLTGWENAEIHLYVSQVIGYALHCTY